MSSMQFYKLVDDCLLLIEAHEWTGPQQLGDKTIRGVRVNTVFLGMEHLGGMFETMIFGGPLDGYMQRYQTVEQARQGHCRIVDALSAPNWLQWHLDGNLEYKLRALIEHKSE